MDKVVRFGVSCEPKLIKEFDEITKKEGYQNRSEAIRDVIRAYVQKEETQKKKILITIIYDPAMQGYHTLEELEQEYHCLIKDSSKRYLGPHTCIEMVYSEGEKQRIEKLIEKIKKINGVKKVTSEWLEDE